MDGRDRPRVLPSEVVARLQRLRLMLRRRVHGRYAGAHTSRRFGSSLDFADYREYLPGDDPRRVDLAAYQRLGRLLVKLYEAEDEAAVRVVVDLSASMGFGDKTRAARQIAAAFAALATGGQDRIRVLLVTGHRTDAGPWFRGPATLAAVESRLLAVEADPPSEEDTGQDASAALAAAVRRARGEGPAGPVVLVSDLLFDGWQEVLRILAAGRGDASLVHVVGRTDLEPDLGGDVRLVDAEFGGALEVSLTDAALAEHAAARDVWLADIESVCGRHAITYALLVDDGSVGELVEGTLRRLGVVA